MTGIEIRDSGDGIWDDGEWISWAWINSQLATEEKFEADVGRPEDESDDNNPEPSLELSFRILDAQTHYEHTLNVVSPDWGSIGEAYIAEQFDVKLCSRHTEGHDGRLGSDLFEIKTISPHKRRAFVTVKRAGNFNVLAVVRITNDCHVGVRFVERSKLPKGNGGKRIVVTWRTLCKIGKSFPPVAS